MVNFTKEQRVSASLNLHPLHRILHFVAIESGRLFDDRPKRVRSIILQSRNQGCMKALELSISE